MMGETPFIYFGGKRVIADEIWRRLGTPKQYIEPFCGSASVLLAAPAPASLEVVGDLNGFIANFWRAVKHQPQKVAEWADYPVSHVDLGARHMWLLGQRDYLGAALQDPDWPGDAKVAGWWVWGQNAWIGSGWCEWDGKVPHISTPGQGIQAIGQVPHISGPGRGIQAIGQVPHISGPGRGIQAIGQVPHISGPGQGKFLTSSGKVADKWFRNLADRLERVRVVHGEWSRCLNHHYGGVDTAVFLDPPYKKYEALYGVKEPVAGAAEAWAKENPDLKIALCGLVDDYNLPGWRVLRWERPTLTYNGGGTKNREAVWFSPACQPIPDPKQALLFQPEDE